MNAMRIDQPTAVYRIWDAGGRLLYVGCSPSPLIRVHDHARLTAWRLRIASVSVEWFASKSEAAAAEKAAIKSEKPEWNVHHRPAPNRAPGRLSDDGQQMQASDFERIRQGTHPLTVQTGGAA